MSVLGACAIAVAVASLVLALSRRSAVPARLARFAREPRSARRVTGPAVPAGIDRPLAARVLGALVGAVAAAVLALAIPLGPLALLVGAAAGSLAPSLVRDRRRGEERRLAERRTLRLVEWLDTLVAAGRPAESALVALSAVPTGSRLLDDALHEAATSYGLGAPLYRALASAAAARGVPALAVLANELERSRELARGTLVAIRDQRETLRARERARGLDAASRVDGSLMLVLVLCYLPALALLVVVPLFLDLFAGLELAVP